MSIGGHQGWEIRQSTGTRIYGASLMIYMANSRSGYLKDFEEIPTSEVFGKEL